MKELVKWSQAEIVAEVQVPGAIEPADIESLVEVLGQTAVTGLVDQLGGPLVRNLLKSGIHGHELQRAARRFDREGLERLLADGLHGADVAALSKLDETTFRKLHAALGAGRILELQRELTTSRLGALAAELPPAVIDRLYNDLTPTRLTALLDTLTRRGINSVFNALGVSGLELVARIQQLESSGKVQGLRDWVSYSITRMNKRGPDLANTAGELVEAERIVASTAPGEVVVVGRDAHAGGNSSIDLAVKDARGAILREIDVTRVQASVTDASQFMQGVNHARYKASSSVAGSVEVTIQCTLAASEALSPNTRIIYPDGTSETVDASGKIQDRGDLLGDLAETMNGNERFRSIARVTITTNDGILIGKVEQQAARFVAVR